MLIGLFVISMVAMWGSAAQAFNRINGIIIRHGSIEVEVILCGNPLVDTLLTLALEVEVEIQCKNPAGKIVPGKPGHPTFSLTFSAFQDVPFADFDPDDTNGGLCDNGNGNNGTTRRIFTFDFPAGLKCKQKNWKKVPGSELAKSIEVTAKWCTDDNNNNSCQDGERIEFVETSCTGSRNGEGGPNVSCAPVDHVDGLEGQPAPPLEEPCVDIYKHCSFSQPGQTLLETVCGAGVHTLAPFTAANISYVIFNDTTTSVRLHHCIDYSALSGATKNIFDDTSLCRLTGGCCGNPRWNDKVCKVEINPPILP